MSSKQALSMIKILKGLPMSEMGRAGPLDWIHFGKMRKRIIGNEERMSGDFGLHIQCAWRIETDRSILLGSRTKFQPVHGEWTPEFRYDVQGGNMADVNMKRFNSIREDFRVVVDITTDLRGGVCMQFQGGFRLVIFPEDCNNDEFWRLLDLRSAGGAHYVFGNKRSRQDKDFFERMM